jgi:hypothetical protein
LAVRRRERDSSGGFLISELVIPGRITIYPMEGGRDTSGRFLVNELVIPGRITIYPVEGECWQSADEKSSGW